MVLSQVSHGVPRNSGTPSDLRKHRENAEWDTCTVPRPLGEHGPKHKPAGHSVIHKQFLRGNTNCPNPRGTPPDLHKHPTVPLVDNSHSVAAQPDSHCPTALLLRRCAAAGTARTTQQDQQLEEHPTSHRRKV